MTKFFKYKLMRNFFLLGLFLFCHVSLGQVVLNEIYIRPDGLSTTPPNGLIFTDSKEYIEIYNKGCSPIDISGYFIAMKQQGFGTTVTGGTIRIPNGTLINPGQHLVLGSPAPGAGLVGNIDIPITSAIRCNYTANFVIANVDGWVALYDAVGTPIECVYWSGAAGNITSASFTDAFTPPGSICLPTGSPVVTLPTARQIFQSNPRFFVFLYIL